MKKYNCLACVLGNKTACKDCDTYNCHKMTVDRILREISCKKSGKAAIVK